jgi:DNA sulfur modification protein DndE
MAINRIYVDAQVERSLTNLKARTGLTPNLLCRIGFCMSLAEPGIPEPSLYNEGNAREFNLQTLTGDYNEFFFALLRQRLVQDELDIDEHLESQFKAHISRGVLRLDLRVKNLEDITRLIAEAQERPNQTEGVHKSG